MGFELTAKGQPEEDTAALVEEGQAARLSGVDFFKVIAIFGVICFHTYPFGKLGLLSLQYHVAYATIRGISGFAVQFFFIASGYFFALKISEGRITIGRQYARYAGRLLLLLVSWSLIYLLAPPLPLVRSEGVGGAFSRNLSDQLQRISASPATTLAEGVSSHLWFIIALLIGLSIVALLIKLGTGRLYIYLGLALYCFGLLAGAYTSTPIGLHAGFNTRNGPFQAVLLVGIGVLLASRRFRPSLRLSLVLVAAGLSLHLAENYIISTYFWEGVTAEYYLGTPLLATGIMMLALARPDIGRGWAVTSWSVCVLGIYLVHQLIITDLPAWGVLSVPWQLVFPVVVFTVSLACVEIIRRIPLLRRIVI